MLYLSSPFLLLNLSKIILHPEYVLTLPSSFAKIKEVGAVKSAVTSLFVFCLKAYFSFQVFKASTTISAISLIPTKLIITHPLGTNRCINFEEVYT